MTANSAVDVLDLKSQGSTESAFLASAEAEAGAEGGGKSAATSCVPFIQKDSL